MENNTPLNGVVVTPSEDGITTGSDTHERKSVKIWVILGVSALLGMLIALFLFIIIRSSAQHSEPEREPKLRNASSNPFVCLDNSQDDERTRVIILYNNRTAIERNKIVVSKRPIDVKNTTENFEPNYIKVTFKQLDEHLLNVKYNDPEWPRWEVPDYGHDKDPYSDVSDLIIPREFDPEYKILSISLNGYFMEKGEKLIPH